MNHRDYVRQIDSSGLPGKTDYWHKLHLDPFLLLMLLILNIFALIVLYSASDDGIDAIKRQGSFLLIASPVRSPPFSPPVSTPPS